MTHRIELTQDQLDEVFSSEEFMQWRADVWERMDRKWLFMWDRFFNCNEEAEDMLVRMFVRCATPHVAARFLSRWSRTYDLRGFYYTGPVGPGEHAANVGTVCQYN